MPYTFRFLLTRCRRSDKVAGRRDSCPVSCASRKGCSQCSSCTWCPQTKDCLSNTDLVTKAWLRSCGAHDDNCGDCSLNRDCASCQSVPGCGWCFNEENALEGTCVSGGFETASSSCKKSYIYEQCPDVDECALNMHNCHPEAVCSNVQDGFECSCSKGFAGDGVSNCSRTCSEACVHGRCSGPPDYACLCNVGWTGGACDVDCGCNGHATCSGGVGSCDECMDRTAGSTCERCADGSFGNATDEGVGCRKCQVGRQVKFTSFSASAANLLQRLKLFAAPPYRPPPDGRVLQPVNASWMDINASPGKKLENFQLLCLPFNLGPKENVWQAASAQFSALRQDISVANTSQLCSD